MRTKTLSFLIVVFSALAAVACYNLLQKHISGTPGPSWFEAGCSDRDAGSVSCAAVLRSPYSLFPPKRADEPPGTQHVPVAFLGLVYYTTLAIWFVGIAAPSRGRAWLHLLPTLLVGFGLCGSAWFTWLMFRTLDAWCPWCLVTHVFNVLIAVCIVLLWPAVMTAAGDQALGDAATPAATAAGATALPATAPVILRRPAWHAALLTVIAIAGVNYGHWNMLGFTNWKRTSDANKHNFDVCMSQLDTFKSDPILLAVQWQRSPERPIPRREDDPARVYTSEAFDGPPLDVVLFSDFECTSCERFARFFEARVVPMFAGRIQTTFKHYPIDRSCNPKAVGPLQHPHACEAAKMAEGVRMVAGNDAFWRAHDFLFNHRSDLAAGKMTLERLANELKLDREALAKAASSDEAAQRIVADADLAARLGITGTPAVYVEDRALSVLVKGEPGFWNAVADAYWEGTGTPRPAGTVPTSLKPAASTPAESTNGE